MSLDQGKMMIAYDRKRTSTLTLDEQPGAHTGSTRKYIPGYSDSNIVYLNTASGNDSNDGSTELLAKLTYASAATAAGSTKKIRVINDGAALSTNITKPTEMKRGVSGTISSSLTAPVNTFTQAATPGFGGSGIYGMAWVPWVSKFVAVGDSGKIYNSSDANTWSAAATPSFSTTRVRAVAVSSPLKICVAVAQGKIAYSVDADTWTQASTPLSNTAFYRRIVWADFLNAFFAITVTGDVVRSTDGVNWSLYSKVNFGTDTQIEAMAVSERLGLIFVGGGDATTGKIYRSQDGIVWSECTFSGQTVYDIYETPSTDKVVAVTNLGIIVYSTLGTSFTQAITPGFGSDRVNCICGVTETSIFVAGDENGTLNYSSDADTWAAVGTPSFGTATIQCAAYSPLLGRLVFGSLNGTIGYSTAFANTISASIAGFTVQAVQYSGTITAYNCTFKQPGTTANLSTENCRFTEDGAHISSNAQTHYGDLYEESFRMTCTPSTQNAVAFNACTVGGSLYIHNASATGFEQVRDNLIVGGIKADYNVTVSGRDNIQGKSTNLLRGASVTSNDPKFVDTTDYNLQYQTNGYPRNSLAAGRSNIYFNTSGGARDLGAWSYIESAISYYYAKNAYINKGLDITVEIEETVSEQQGDNGPVSVYTNPDRIKEVLTIQYGATDDTDRAIFDYIRTLTDKGVKIQLDPEFSANGGTVTVNGNQSAGVEFLTVDSVATFNGMFLTIAGERYWVMRASPSASAATKLILDRPLETGVSDNDVITTNYPSGAGEYQFSPPPVLALKRKDNSTLLTWKTGLSLRFVREWAP